MRLKPGSLVTFMFEEGYYAGYVSHVVGKAVWIDARIGCVEQRVRRNIERDGVQLAKEGIQYASTKRQARPVWEDSGEDDQQWEEPGDSEEHSGQSSEAWASEQQ